MNIHKVLIVTLLSSLVSIGGIGVAYSFVAASRPQPVVTKVIKVTVTPTLKPQVASISATPSATPKPTSLQATKAATPKTPSFAVLCNDPHFYNELHYAGYCAE